MLFFNDVLFVEALQNYVAIHTSSKKYISYLTFKSIEEYLPPESFLKTHKSFIVSVDSITAIRKTSVFLNNIELTVGDNFRSAIDKLVSRS